jgi:mannose/fructose/N-acetylgalactosamine-specific phosphotransferase system component IIC
MANYTVIITETLSASDKITIDVALIAFKIVVLSTMLTILVSTFLHLLHKTLDNYITRTDKNDSTPKRYFMFTILFLAMLIVFFLILYLASPELISIFSIFR